MAIMGCLQETITDIVTHPQCKPVSAVVTLVALTIIFTIVLTSHQKIGAYFIDLFDYPENHTTGAMVFSAFIVLAVVGPIFAIKKAVVHLAPGGS